MKALLAVLPVILAMHAANRLALAEVRVIDGTTHHLGIAGKPEWDIFESNPPEGEQLRIEFPAQPNDRESTLFIRQDDVKQDWTVKLNGKRLGSLFLMEADLVQTLAIPPGALRDGPNEITISTRASDDIVIRGLALGDNSKENLLTAGPVTVTVREKGLAEPMPCRLTLMDGNGSLAPIYDFGNTNLAVRPGVIYTATGSARFKLLPGKYTLYATRGPEYEAGVVNDLDPQKTDQIELTLERQANTRGWVACDTHLHSLTLSRHGDASLDERVITLAGEGIELPVATEHNLHADYRPTASAHGLSRYFTAVPGNEVTTGYGHFNIFPVDTNAPPPTESGESWPSLLKQIRETPNVQIVTLNHPTDIHGSFTPFAQTNLNYATGRNLRGNFPFAFDAMELINSGAMRSDWMEPFRAWFALLNRGYHITGIGSSDCHDVSRFIAGQGRTYIQVDDANVGQIDVQKACEALKSGHALVSLGLMANLTLEDERPGSTRAGPGDFLALRGNALRARMTVDAPLAPGRAPRFQLYANGDLLKEFSAPAGTGPHHEVDASIAKPAHDTFYVLIASLDFNPTPEWGLARPYQPTSRHFDLRLLGATNPIRVDGDGDGRFSSARDYATRLLAQRPSTDQLLAALASFDSRVAAQCAELLEASGQDLNSAEWRSLLERAAPGTRLGFDAYRAGELKR